jgi:hypothetical protein
MPARETPETTPVNLVRVNVTLVFEDIPEDTLVNLRQQFRNVFSSYRVTTFEMRIIAQPKTIQERYLP